MSSLIRFPKMGVFFMTSLLMGLLHFTCLFNPSLPLALGSQRCGVRREQSHWSPHIYKRNRRNATRRHTPRHAMGPMRHTYLLLHARSKFAPHPARMPVMLTMWHHSVCPLIKLSSSLRALTSPDAVLHAPPTHVTPSFTSLAAPWHGPRQVEEAAHQQGMTALEPYV